MHYIEQLRDALYAKSVNGYVQMEDVSEVLASFAKQTDPGLVADSENLLEQQKQHEFMVKLDAKLIHIMHTASVLYGQGVYNSYTQAKLNQVKDDVREVRKMLNLKQG